MVTDVSWIVELSVQPGCEKDFNVLMHEMVAATRASQAGALDYQWSMNADGTMCHIFERYADSAGVLAQLAAFREKFAGRFREILKPVRFVVYGTPNQEVKEALTAFKATYMQPVGGFSR